MRVQQRGVKPRVLTLFIALACAGRIKRAHVCDVKIFKQLIQIGQIGRSYC